MQKKTWMISFLFKEFLFFFKKSIWGRVSFTYTHILIMDGHNNNVTLK
jgi:hypothetical protein